MHITKKRDLWLFLAALTGGNFIVFVIFIAFAGGTPDYIKNGHYYLSRNGRVTEVPPAVYRCVQVHTWVTFPLTLFGVFALRRW
jgi:hypothetical protein